MKFLHTGDHFLYMDHETVACVLTAVLSQICSTCIQEKCFVSLSLKVKDVLECGCVNRIFFSRHVCYTTLSGQGDDRPRATVSCL